MEVKRSGALTARGADKLRGSRSPAAHSAGGGRGEASARLTALVRKA